MVDIRKSFIGMMTSVMVSFVIVVCLILFWAPLTVLVADMNVGLLMFFNVGFWQFMAFFMGLVFIVTLVIRFAMNARFKRRD